MNRAAATAIVVLAIAVALVMGVSWRGRDEGARCGPGFVPTGARCLTPAGRCPAPLAPEGERCDAPDLRVPVPAATVYLGPSDWEATGVEARIVRVDAFRIDAFEVTMGRWGTARGVDAARAVSGVTRAEAEAYCAARGGHLPSDDQWIAAAVSPGGTARRYPWGDTGAVCRRAAWGLAHGPCATGADGPDTVGAHRDGDSPLGLHDVAGNVAEWLAPSAEDPSKGAARGGSWQSELASGLRVWSKVELSPGARDPRVGLRCAYPP